MASLQPQPATATASKKRIEPAALTLLLQIPNTDAATLQQCLFIARLVKPTEEIYPYIITYVENGLVHGFGIKVTNIFRLVRDNDVEFDHDDNMKNEFRMMLWHGTKESTVAGIIQNGFKIPTAKNQMFGTGIYFADRSSKSANYCLPQLGQTPTKGSTAYMFLCDVAVGQWYNSKNPKNSVSTAPIITTKSGQTRPCDSVKCTGANIPDESESVDFYNCLIPLGKTVKNTKFSSYTVQYNEFIVYDSNRVRMKYLVKIEFT